MNKPDYKELYEVYKNDYERLRDMYKSCEEVHKENRILRNIIIELKQLLKTREGNHVSNI